MTKLFAGLDAAGEPRFIGEVPRGLACGCRCPECGSPLVAKQGNELDWHFAHEGGQERPECEAGAMNMLRRLAIAHLQGLPALALPPYVERVQISSVVRSYVEEVRWQAQPVRPPAWVERPVKHGPVASLRLDNGIDADLLVEFGSDWPTSFPPTPETRNAVVFWSTVPCVSDLRKRIYAEQHIRQCGQFVWRHQRDVFGLVDAARRRLQAKVAEDVRVFEQARKRAAEAAAERWALQAAQLKANREAWTVATAVAVPLAPLNTTYSWAPARKPGCSFMFYRLCDGSAWVTYEMQEGAAFGIAPYPTADDGWDEALPPSVGVPDLEQRIYVARSLGAALAFLNARRAVLRITSDPREFDGL